MYNFQNKRYIKTELASILIEFMEKVNAYSHLINYFTISDIMLQALFLKLTGAQEQKFKSMLWEWGCIDLECRRYLLNNARNDKEGKNVKNDEQGVSNFPKPSGFSNYRDKIKFVKKMYNKIEALNKSNVKNTPTITIKNKHLCDDGGRPLNEMLIEKTRGYLEMAFNENDSFYRKLRVFRENWNESNGFISCNELLINLQGKDLFIFSNEFVGSCYEKLIQYRHKCAHNLFVYQNQCKSFAEIDMLNADDNIFKWIQTLLVIDELSMYLFEKLESQ